MGDRSVAVQEVESAQDGEELVTMSLMVSADQRTRLRKIAKARQLPVGAVVREAIRTFLSSVAA